MDCVKPVVDAVAQLVSVVAVGVYNYSVVVWDAPELYDGLYTRVIRDMITFELLKEDLRLKIIPEPADLGLRRLKNQGDQACQRLDSILKSKPEVFRRLWWSCLQHRAEITLRNLNLVHQAITNTLLK